MKVLHVADYLPGLHETVGGAEFATLRTIEEQLAMGVEVDVVTLPIDNPGAPRPWRRHYTIHNLDRLAPKAAYAVKQLFVPGDPWAAAGLSRAIASSAPDIVHYHNLHFSGLSTLSRAHAAGIPSVLTIYDYWLFCPSFMLLTSKGKLCERGHSGACVNCIGVQRARMLYPMKKAMFAARPWVFGRTLDGVDRFITLSDASKSILVRHGIAAARVSVIPQYVWQEALELTREVAIRPGRLTYVGWIEARKGLHVVVEAMSLLAREFPTLELEVLGLAANQDYEDDLKQKLVSSGIGERVHFRTKLPKDKLLNALQSAFLVTVPEQWENMCPVIVTEAMAAGACVLASRIGGIPEFIDDRTTGLLAHRDSAQDFARQIRWAMTHPKLIESIGNAARVRASNVFDPVRINQLTLKTYESTIENYA